MSLSWPITNVLIYLTLLSFMFVGLYAGKTQAKNKNDFLAALRTQLAWPLAVNWFASNLGSSVLFAYPEVGVLAGVLGVFMYALASIIPLFVFAWIGPIMRRQCPDGFTLTQFVKERFGRYNQIYMSLMSMAYMFCYMISELSAIGSVLNTLTGIDNLPPIIGIAVTTTLYTAYGGFPASLMTDSVQGVCILILMVIATIAFGTNIHIDKSFIDQSGLLKSNKLGWELFYILTVAIVFANLFHQGYWQRAFASKNDRELIFSTIYGSIFLFPTLFLIGFTGLIAVWAHLCCFNEGDSSVAFFFIFSVLPDWAVGVIVVLSVSLSCSAYDTLQSAMVSTMSNDLFNNRLPLIYIRALTVIFNVPAIVLAIRNLDVLRVFLIGDLVAAAAMPPILLGLADNLYFINGVDALVGSIGGLLSIFIFGTAYFGNAYDGINLIQLPNGIYPDDYSVLGAFIAAPFGGLLITFLSFAIRLAGMYVWAKIQNKEFQFPQRRITDPGKFAGPEFTNEVVEKDTRSEESYVEKESTKENTVV